MNNVFNRLYKHFGLLLLTGWLSACNNIEHLNNNRPDSTQLTSKVDSVQPILTIVQKRFNAGNVKRDRVVEGRYIIRNTGKKNLEIEYINPDCTCTGFSLSKNRISPEDSALLILKMSTKDKEGEVQIHATISANTSTRLYQVSLVANVL